MIVDPAEIERHYRQSPFISELCVFGVSAAGEPGDQRLHALVVPDLRVLRQRKIVNVRELIRFEIEGLSVSLPSHKRLLGFDVTMAPLPRTSSGSLDRREIVERYTNRRVRVGLEADARVDDHLRRVVSVVQEAVGPRVHVRPDSNLELDLGLDSLERVELLASLEQRFGVTMPDEVAHSAFRVCEVAEAFRGAVEGESTGDLWPRLLAVKEPDATLRALRRSRTLTVLFVWSLVRIVVGVLLRPRVYGLEHLPPAGPFIITPNHQSYIDPLVVEWALPFRVFRQLFFVGAAEYFETRVTSRLAGALNIVPVDPDSNLLRAMQAAAFGLRQGKVLMLFPEGERSIDGGVKTFRKGAAILSQQVNVPIVPVAIDGMFEIWPRSRPLAWRRLLPWSGHRVSVRFGARLDAPKPDTAYADHTAALRAAVEDLLTA
jgi:long-chain acyl-CoA synthetase